MDYEKHALVTPQASSLLFKKIWKFLAWHHMFLHRWPGLSPTGKKKYTKKYPYPMLDPYGDYPKTTVPNPSHQGGAQNQADKFL